jgi:hypothetical protein
MAAIEIRSGGQTGVDRAALDVALLAGISYSGWCPKGGWAEDYPQPPGLLAVYPRLTETPSANPKQRTAWNVRDSHATLILQPEIEELDKPRSSLGTEFTYDMASLIFLRPCLVLNPASTEAAFTEAETRAKQWLAQVTDALNLEIFILNVAGPRESEAPGIYTKTLQLLHSIFQP